MPRLKKIHEFSLEEVQKIVQEKFPNLTIDFIYMNNDKLFIEEDIPSMNNLF